MNEWRWPSLQSVICRDKNKCSRAKMTWEFAQSALFLDLLVFENSKCFLSRARCEGTWSLQNSVLYLVPADNLDGHCMLRDRDIAIVSSVVRTWNITRHPQVQTRSIEAAANDPVRTVSCWSTLILSDLFTSSSFSSNTQRSRRSRHACLSDGRCQ
jgi:hypothetical protein